MPNKPKNAEVTAAGSQNGSGDTFEGRPARITESRSLNDTYLHIAFLDGRQPVAAVNVASARLDLWRAIS
jgi:hypothetical protein